MSNRTQTRSLNWSADTHPARASKQTRARVQACTGAASVFAARTGTKRKPAVPSRQRRAWSTLAAAALCVVANRRRGRGSAVSGHWRGSLHARTTRAADVTACMLRQPKCAARRCWYNALRHVTMHVGEAIARADTATRDNSILSRARAASCARLRDLDAWATAWQSSSLATLRRLPNWRHHRARRLLELGFVVGAKGEVSGDCRG